MLKQLSSQSVEEVMSSHLYKQFPGQAPTCWKQYTQVLFAETEKISGSRGWYKIKEVAETQETEKVAPETVEPTQEEPKVVLNSTGVSWVPTQTQTDHEVYSLDKGLMKIALLGANCFGEFVNKGKCKTCPLAGSCQVASFGKIAGFAAELDAETAKALTPEPKEEPKEEVSSEPKEEVKTETPELKEGWKQMKSVITTICSKCEEQIPSGSECINIRGKGNFHMGCAE